MTFGESRRRFLQAVARAGVVGTLGFAGRAERAPGPEPITSSMPELVSGSVVVTDSLALPSPQESGIQHIVVVTMENRSFDHFLGWLRGADARQVGLSYTDNSGSMHSSYPLAPDYTGCGHPDPDHSYGSSRVAYNNGLMDGFLRAGKNDDYSIGYYTEQDLPFFSFLTRHYLTCDRYFASILGPTFPNRMFLWSAQTDRLDDSASFTCLPTIFDSLATAGVSHRYYFNNLPYLALWGVKYLPVASPFQDFLVDAAAGALPAVSFIDPLYTTSDDGAGNDDHPHADVRNGDAFLAGIFQALSSGPAWSNTVLIINFDEWGGFLEHVAPPRVAAPNSVDQDLVNGQALLGFRVPAIVASPFTRNRNPSFMASRKAIAWPPRGTLPQPTALVNHTVFDHTSILKLIEWRWGVQPLTARDASWQIGNLAAVMNFSAPDSSIPSLQNPAPVSAPPCSGPSVSLSAGWTALARTRAAQEWLQHSKFASRR